MKKQEPDNFHLEQDKKLRRQSFAPFPSVKEDGNCKEGQSPPNSSIDSNHQLIFIKEVNKEINNIESPQKTLNFKNPFMKFYNDSNSKPLIPSPEGLRMEFQKKFIGLTPHKDSSSGSQKKLNNWYQETYLKFNEKLLKKPVQSASLFFFKPQGHQKLTYSKLLWFNPNRKNGRHLIYNKMDHKCIPVYRCEGCFKQFSVPSALGGHLSSCAFKDEHKLKIRQNRPIIRGSTEINSIDWTNQRLKLRSNLQFFNLQKKNDSPENEIFFESKSSRSKEKTIKKVDKKYGFHTIRRKKVNMFPLRRFRYKRRI